MRGADPDTEATPGCFKPFLVVSVIIPLDIVVGCMFGQSAEMLPQLLEPDSLIPITREQATWIASLPDCGILLTGWVAGSLADKFGRLRVMQACLFFFTIGFGIVAGAENYQTVIIGRFLVGLGSGFSFSAFVYVAESSPVKYRGSFVALISVCSSVGLALMYVIGAILPWNIASGIISAIAGFGFVLSFLYYEPPQWLVQKGRIEEAQSSIRRIEHPDNVEATLRQIQETDAEDRKQKKKSFGIGSILEPTIWKPLLMVAAMAALQNGSGFYIFLHYAVSFTSELRTPSDPHLVAIAMGFARILSTAFASYLLRHVKRRTMGAISGLGSTFALLVIFAFHQLRQSYPELVEGITWIQAYSLAVYIMTSGLGIFPLPWIMPSELFPLQVRGAMVGISSTMMAAFMFMSVKMYVVILDNLGIQGMVLLFAGSSFLFAVFSLTLLVETHKKTLEEIQMVFTTCKSQSETDQKEVSRM